MPLIILAVFDKTSFHDETSRFIASSIETFGTKALLSNALLINFLTTRFEQ